MKRGAYCAVGVAALILQLSQSGYGQEVSAKAWVDSTRYVVGDPITVNIELSHQRGCAFRPLVGDTLGGFFVLEKTGLEPQSDTATVTSVVVAKYDLGTAVLPPIEFLYTVPGDTLSHTVASNPVILTILTVAVDTSKDIKDVKPPLSLPLTLAEIALYAAIVLAIVVVAYLVYRYWKKRQSKKGDEAYIPPVRPAHVIALEELAILKEKRLWQQGLIKEYYSELTEIIRRYFENRYNFQALEQTSDEIMRDLKKHQHAEQIFEESEKMLHLADLVKFAKFQPGIPDHEEMMVIAHRIIDKTRVVETKSSAQPEQMVMSDVGQ